MAYNSDKAPILDTAQRNAQIVELSQSGLSAQKIRTRLKLQITARAIQRVIEKQLGPVVRTRKSDANALGKLRPLVVECLKMLGKNPFICDVCEASQVTECEIHHTKYEGATIYDLQFVCLSCNRARAGSGLS